MKVRVEEFEGMSSATVEWNDNGERCFIKSADFGELRVEESTLRALYECLDFLFGRPKP